MYGHKDIRSRIFLHVLDILDQNSILSLKQRLLENYGGKFVFLDFEVMILKYLITKEYKYFFNILGLDILVNNAARIYFPDSSESYEKQARDTIETNYYGNKWVFTEISSISYLDFCSSVIQKV